MTEHQIVVNVHRTGNDPVRDARPETATVDADGRLYVRHNNRWWMLSNGVHGWHSINVGISDIELAARLDIRSGRIKQ